MQRPLPCFIYLFIFCLYHKKSWCAQLVGRQTSRKIISTSGQFRFRSSIIYDEEERSRSCNTSCISLWISQFSSFFYVCYKLFLYLHLIHYTLLKAHLYQLRNQVTNWFQKMVNSLRGFSLLEIMLFALPYG